MTREQSENSLLWAKKVGGSVYGALDQPCRSSWVQYPSGGKYVELLCLALAVHLSLEEVLSHATFLLYVKDLCGGSCLPCGTPESQGSL